MIVLRYRRQLCTLKVKLTKIKLRYSIPLATFQAHDIHAWSVAAVMGSLGSDPIQQRDSVEECQLKTADKGHREGQSTF